MAQTMLPLLTPVGNGLLLGANGVKTGMEQLASGVSSIANSAVSRWNGDNSANNNAAAPNASN